jgi:hypothetical protein
VLYKISHSKASVFGIGTYHGMKRGEQFVESLRVVFDSQLSTEIAD